ncbi:MAG: protein kinase [Candidatus Riflebacteria bacterium]|nr:protein kinase [Candidatus Riflebacteria bacterium]
MRDYKCPACRKVLPRAAAGGKISCDGCGFQFQVMDQPRAPTRQPRVQPTKKVAVAPPSIRLEGYKIVDRIGEGGMGEVFKAEQPGRPGFVAIKVLLPELSENPQIIQRFEREASTTASLPHPGVVKILTRGKTKDGQYFLVMEFVEGESLRDALQCGKLGFIDKVQVALAVADTLAYAHAKNVLHRDIKPENVMVFRTQGRLKVKVLDFGLAAALQRDPDQPQLTRDGAIIGTPYYMSPEQRFDPRKVDGRTDIYSLGVVFYEMLAGDLPTGLYKLPSEVNPQIPAVLDPIVEIMIAPEAERRYSTMEQAATEIRRALGLPSQAEQSYQGQLAPPLLSTASGITDRQQVMIVGKAPPGTRVIVEVNRKEYPTVVPSSGQFAVEVPLEIGRNLVTARAVELEQRSAAAGLVELIRPPAPPSLNYLPEQTSRPVVAIAGTTMPGGQVVLKVNLRESRPAVNEQGEFSTEVGLDEGPNKIEALSEFNNVRSASAALFTVTRMRKQPVAVPAPALAGTPPETMPPPVAEVGAGSPVGESGRDDDGGERGFPIAWVAGGLAILAFVVIGWYLAIGRRPAADTSAGPRPAPSLAPVAPGLVSGPVESISPSMAPEPTRSSRAGSVPVANPLAAPTAAPAPASSTAGDRRPVAPGSSAPHPAPVPRPVPIALSHLSFIRMELGLPAFRNAIDGSAMVLFPGGTVQRGMPENEPQLAGYLRDRYGRQPISVALACSAPCRDSVSPFLIDLTEVSAGQWSVFLGSGRAAPQYPGAGERTLQQKYLAQLRSTFPTTWRLYPMVYVTWEDARAYGRWSRKELPSESMWEAAARHGHNGSFPWGGHLFAPSVATGRLAAWKDGTSLVPPLDVVTAGPPGPGGLRHLAGNVAEWCDDVFCTDPTDNRQCSEAERSCRGGSWKDEALLAVSTYFRDHHVRLDKGQKAHGPARRTPDEERILAQTSFIGFRGSLPLTQSDAAALWQLTGQRR